MPAPLLATKLYLPGPRTGRVRRRRLDERLERGAATRLVLVSAPAGFGKTTLLAEWLATRAAGPENRCAAWVSLDRGDSDPRRFWTYVITALRSAVPEAGASALHLLDSAQPPPTDLVLTTLLNDLAAAGRDVVLVLDDYHLVEAAEVHTAMAFFLDHLPACLHVVLAGRADPALPLARLRARGELVEIRAADLRFTPDEAAAYLTDVMGLALTPHDVAALESRTEGWVAALQLAALSLHGRDDASGFVAGFSGDDRYVVDYLVEEVLQRQPEAVRAFLLHTCVLSRLTGPLCDAVTGTEGGAAMLTSLDRANLFVVPLDDRRRSYRYHHLFADVLRAHLADEAPDLVPELHRRASRWYEAHGDRVEAISHALSAQDFGTAAHLVELALPDSARDRQEHLWRRWVEQLPPEHLGVRPVLSNGYAGALLSTGEIEGVDRHLDDAARWLGPPVGPDAGSTADGPAPDPASMLVADEAQLRRLPAWVAVHRAGLAMVRGDLAGTVSHARLALDLREDDEVFHGAATALIGLASWAGGDLEAARESYVRCLGSLRRADRIGDVLGCSIALADIQATLGRLREARRTYEDALRLGVPDGGRPVRGAADMYVGLAALEHEAGELDSARALLARSEALGEHTALPQNASRWRVATARVLAADGDVDGAAHLLDEAERLHSTDFSPDVRPVHAVRARVWAAHGRVSDALDWARQERVDASDDLHYLREYTHVTLVRVLLAQHAADRRQGPLDDATALLARLLRAAEEGRRGGTVVELLVLQALAGSRRRDLPAATSALARALVLAEPEGYVRTFLDEGEPVLALLGTLAAHGPARDHARRLLARAGSGRRWTPRGDALVEPLTERERAVLRLLGTELTGPQIAAELVVSLNTVRTHTKNIYAKLGVTNRRAAVRRAGELSPAETSGTRPRGA